MMTRRGFFATIAAALVATKVPIPKPAVATGFTAVTYKGIPLTYSAYAGQTLMITSKEVRDCYEGLLISNEPFWRARPSSATRDLELKDLQRAFRETL